MKRALSISCLWICLLVLSSSVIMGQDNHLDITPTPQSLVQKNGHFTLNSKTSFAIGKNQRADLKKVAAYFQSKILYSTGYNLNIKNSGSSNAISLQIDKSLKIGNEGYQLTVTPKKVIVKAKTPQGIFYGMQSVMQLLPPQIESETIIDNVAWEIPCVEIKDEPAYGYRGMMLDVCRHFHDVEFVKKLLRQQPTTQVTHRIPYRQKTYSQYSKENERHVFPVYTNGIGVDNKAAGCP